MFSDVLANINIDCVPDANNRTNSLRSSLSSAPLFDVDDDDHDASFRRGEKQTTLLCVSGRMEF